MAASTSVTIGLKSPADDGAARATFLRWIWYAARREGLHLDGADDDFSTPARVQMAMRTVVAPALRLSHTDQQSLTPHAKIVRYGTDEVVQFAGEVPTAMTFLTKGRVRLTATAEDGSVLSVSVLEEGSFLGVTTLTRQPNLATAYALEEVTALEIDREHIEDLVMRSPFCFRSWAASSKTGESVSATRRRRCRRGDEVGLVCSESGVATRQLPLREYLSATATPLAGL